MSYWSYLYCIDMLLCNQTSALALVHSILCMDALILTGGVVCLNIRVRCEVVFVSIRILHLTPLWITDIHYSVTKWILKQHRFGPIETTLSLHNP